MANRPETACSKAHGETSVLLNFTDFPSPLYRFIYYRPVARIISISVKQRPIVDAIYDRFTWTPSPLFVHVSSTPRFFSTAFLPHKRGGKLWTGIHEPEHGPPPYYLSRTLVPYEERERENGNGILRSLRSGALPRPRSWDHLSLAHSSLTNDPHRKSRLVTSTSPTNLYIEWFREDICYFLLLFFFLFHGLPYISPWHEISIFHIYISQIYHIYHISPSLYYYSSI